MPIGESIADEIVNDIKAMSKGVDVDPASEVPAFEPCVWGRSRRRSPNPEIRTDLL